MPDTTLDAEILAPPAAPPRTLRVAIVDEELPYPPTSGKRIRTLNLVSRLAKRHRLAFLCHRNFDERETAPAVEHFERMGVECVVVERVRPQKTALQKGPGFYAKLAANLLSPKPYLVDVNDSPALRRAVSEHDAKHAVDLWQCESTPYAEAMRGVPASRRLIMAHNVESLIWRRYEENEANPLKRWYIGVQRRKFERYERAVFAASAGNVAVSPEDARLMREEFAAPGVSVVDNGVDTEYFHLGTSRRDPGRVLFLGSLDWRPNLDGVEQLLNKIFPEVRAAEPSATLDVVGRNPPAWLVEAVAKVPGAALHADVPDARPYLHRASVMAVPLRIGGGSRLKILESLATGLPVASTRVGAEGLLLEPGEHVEISEGADDLAAAVLRLLRDPARAALQAGRGRARVLERYDWDAIALDLERSWIDAAGAAR